MYRILEGRGQWDFGLKGNLWGHLLPPRARPNVPGGYTHWQVGRRIGEMCRHLKWLRDIDMPGEHQVQLQRFLREIRSEYLPRRIGNARPDPAAQVHETTRPCIADESGGAECPGERGAGTRPNGQGRTRRGDQGAKLVRNDPTSEGWPCGRCGPQWFCLNRLLCIRHGTQLLFRLSQAGKSRKTIRHRMGIHEGLGARWRRSALAAATAGKSEAAIAIGQTTSKAPLRKIREQLC